MKKIFILLVVACSFVACKKAITNTPTNNTNSSTCVDNPNINFTSIGTPIGKFGECIKDTDGNTYKTVTIGTQTWMAENLKTSKYNDGTLISNDTNYKLWENNTSGSWRYYLNDSTNNKTYGKWYNWYAISPTTNGNKNVCPTGWHVPTKTEWTILIDYLGGDTIAGFKMKEISSKHWKYSDNKATNTSLFSVLPGGYIGSSGPETYILSWGYLWSSTKLDSEKAWNINFPGYNGDKKIGYALNSYYDMNTGCNIRCLKD